MPLLSAFDDFFQRSVSVLPNVWEKLRFVGNLHTRAGEYHHYGMEERFGKEEAQAAIAAAHSVLYEELASTSLKELWRAAESHGQGYATPTVVTLLQSIQVQRRNARDLHGVPPEHIQFITTNLTRIAQTRDQSSRATA